MPYIFSIHTGKTAYVDGTKITGTLDPSTGPDTSDATASASDIRNGKTAYVNGSKITGSMSEKSATTYNVSTSDQTISSGQYLSGVQTIRGVTTSNITASNIKKGVTVTVGDAGSSTRIKNVTGTYSGTDTSDATAAASNILSGKTAYVNGSKITGTMTNIGALNGTITNGLYYTIPEGYHNGSGWVHPVFDEKLVWTNPYPYSDFVSGTIYFTQSVSTGGEYLLIYYKDHKDNTSVVRHSIVWAPSGYSSCIDNRGNQGAGTSNSEFSCKIREFFLSSNTSMWFGPSVELAIKEGSVSQTFLSNESLIPTSIYALGTTIGI